MIPNSWPEVAFCGLAAIFVLVIILIAVSNGYNVSISPWRLLFSRDLSFGSKPTRLPSLRRQEGREGDDGEGVADVGSGLD